jgi:4-deoxy-L-threo-5-hexosulose-uronate ketol-isomerase
VQQRYATTPDQLPSFDSDELRQQYLVEKVFVPGEVTVVYTHYDRVVLGGAAPAGKPLPLPTFDYLRAV